MGDLPMHRIVKSNPFTKIAIDFAGPFLMKSNIKRSKVKLISYVALFVCFCTKAVHIEIVSDLSSAAFLAALKRCISRRGKPSDIFSDNRTNFKGDNNIHREQFGILKASTIQKFISNERINWHFIPPSAPNFGGDLIFLKDTISPPAIYWSLGRITKVFPGADGKVRVVKREQRLFEVKPFCPCFDFVSHRNGGSTNLHQVLCEKRIQRCRNILDVANSLRGCRHEPKTSFRVVQALQGGSGRDCRQRTFRETSTSTTPEKVDKVLELVRKDRRITVREVAKEAGISFGSTQSIMKDILGVRRLNAVLVPKDLNFDKKEHPERNGQSQSRSDNRRPRIAEEGYYWRRNMDLRL
ncbi:hypothetical protein LAZ67_9002308 [Cordylochernes scorpioides]|uniref:DUF5641 domain-containing protein n=1 Tax=Cordylochernes scorpioides TaxID=51811 RepID=A0ABY6KVR0_9ARAC|nr:hypothetical protein LAZ67_9002308 [Cordylochernes scorpioides]